MNLFGINWSPTTTFSKFRAPEASLKPYILMLSVAISVSGHAYSDSYSFSSEYLAYQELEDGGRWVPLFKSHNDNGSFRLYSEDGKNHILQTENCVFRIENHSVEELSDFNPDLRSIIKAFLIDEHYSSGSDQGPEASIGRANFLGRMRAINAKPNFLGRPSAFLCNNSVDQFLSIRSFFRNPRISTNESRIFLTYIRWQEERSKVVFGSAGMTEDFFTPSQSAIVQELIIRGLLYALQSNRR